MMTEKVVELIESTWIVRTVLPLLVEVLVGDAVQVVGLPPVGIRQQLISLLDFNELLLGIRS